MKRVLGAQTGRESMAPPAPEEGGTASGRVSSTVIDYVLSAGLQAPSGDNAQPWKFRTGDNRIEVSIDPDADASFFNVCQMASVISAGAVVENMVIAAGGCGFEGRVSLFPRHDDADLAARIELVPTDEPPDPLIGSIWRRHTNRTMYHDRPLVPAAIDAVTESVADFEGARLHVLDDKARLRRLAKVIRTADLLRVSHRGLHEHFHSMVRHSSSEAEATGDGFPLENLEAGAAGNVFIKLSRPWPVMNVLNSLGMGRIFASAAARGLRHCSAAALLTVPGIQTTDFATGGRALQRAWLTLTDLGLDVQPMTAITLFWLRCQLEGEDGFAAPHRRLLRSLWDEYRSLFADVDFSNDGQVMLFRFGHGRPMKVHTRRKPLESFVERVQ
jgi:hypothetical protein